VFGFILQFLSDIILISKNSATYYHKYAEICL